uniref:Dynastin-6 n=1 Tax=Limnodynastes salmini TaxID=39404 RepID=DYS6_LIMSA|nr:RecName: Full=Dynastin-6 [Limnodynastes salmini]prf//1923189C dynastin 6 [Limnodynastes salmini]
GAVSGLLTNL